MADSLKSATRTLVDGDSVESARSSVTSRIPAGQFAVATRVVDEGGLRSQTFVAATLNEALRQASASRSAGSAQASQRVLSEPGPAEVSVRADNESEAGALALQQLGPGTSLIGVRLVTPPRKGMMGVGRAKAQYQVAGVRQAVVEVAWSRPARIEVLSVQDPVTTSLEFIREGKLDRGRALLDKICQAQPYNVGALAVAAYEWSVRESDPEKYRKGEQYLAMLGQVAPGSREFHTCMALEHWLNLHEFRAAFAAAEAAAGSSAHVVPLYLLADIANGEWNYQILKTPRGDSMTSLAVTPRLAGLSNLFQRQLERALDAFREGVSDAGRTVAQLPEIDPDPAYRPRLIANIRRDCRVGEGLTLIDQGYETEGRDRIAAARDHYQREFPR